MVGSTDDLASSHELVQHWFPWLAPYVDPADLPHLNHVAHTTHASGASSNATTRKDLLPETDKMIRQWYHMEIMVRCWATPVHGFKLPPCLPAYLHVCLPYPMCFQ